MTEPVSRLMNPKLKMARAKEHLDALNRGVLAFSESKPYRISTNSDLHRGKYMVFMESDTPPPSLGPIADDFICSLRSSLDHLAWQLAASNGNKRPAKTVCFPIFGEDSAHTQKLITEATKGITANAIARVKELQPYNSRSAYKDTHLWLLNKLWNIGKHRQTVLHACALDIHFPRVPTSFGPPDTEIVDNRGVVTFPLAVEQYMCLEPARLRVEVQFGDEHEGIAITIERFFDIYKFVSEEVFPSFEGFFP
jgi:hypothetical protein